MKIGASTSNFYPMPTEDSLATLLDLGFRSLEVFVNTESEARPAFAGELRRRAEAEGGEILSLHSYTAGTDPYLLFSAYRRRFEDGKEHYRRLFEAAAVAGARYVVIHGDKQGGVLPEQEVFARYEELYDLGRSQGVTLLQENVVHFRSADPAFLRRMREALGEKARFAFDIKQCARCGLKPEAVLAGAGLPRGLDPGAVPAELWRSVRAGAGTPLSARTAGGLRQTVWNGSLSLAWHILQKD